MLSTFTHGCIELLLVYFWEWKSILTFHIRWWILHSK
jgi:hypothetical protein